MFTGIIEEVGRISAAGHHMRIQCRKVLEGTKSGDSIAVNGVCLTAVEVVSDGFWCDLSPETLARTNLGDLRDGSIVNLERPAAVGDRLSGHIVQGHVDATAVFAALDPLPEGNWWLAVRIPAELDRYVIPKGSLTLDGVSLTVASLDACVVGVAIIPHTYENTVMCEYRPGARINLEVDLIGKYVEKLLAPRQPSQ
ncbi:MAG TPA: riboflavin synthase [Bryobacteraceae bacterium]|nr:riboflavin synthase [Bryobacteraceae bacterium]